MAQAKIEDGGKQPNIVSIEIAAGQSISEAIYLVNSRMVGIITPALETGSARLAFLASSDGITWTTEHVVYEGEKYTLPITDPTKTYPLATNLQALFPFSYLKIAVLKTDNSAQAQTTAKTLKVIYTVL